MKLHAQEEFAHVLLEQVPQTVLVEILCIEFVNEAHEHASLAPFEQADLEIDVFLAALGAL